VNEVVGGIDTTQRGAERTRIEHVTGDKFGRPPDAAAQPFRPPNQTANETSMVFEAVQ
jgi:hypothetical protein